MKDKWKMPNITINGDHVCYDVDRNTINLGAKHYKNLGHIAAPNATPEELCTACIIHESTHWTQMQSIEDEDRLKVINIYKKEKVRSFVEQHAVEIENDWLENIGKLIKR
jgi:hypothetical protein